MRDYVLQLLIQCIITCILSWDRPISSAGSSRDRLPSLSCWGFRVLRPELNKNWEWEQVFRSKLQLEITNFQRHITIKGNAGFVYNGFVSLPRHGRRRGGRIIIITREPKFVNVDSETWKAKRRHDEKIRARGRKRYINASHNPSPPKKYPREISKLMYTNVWIPIRGKIHGVCIIANTVWSTSMGGSVHSSVRFEGWNGFKAIGMSEGPEAKEGGLSPRSKGKW